MIGTSLLIACGTEIVRRRCVRTMISITLLREIARRPFADIDIRFNYAIVCRDSDLGDA